LIEAWTASHRRPRSMEPVWCAQVAKCTTAKKLLSDVMDLIKLGDVAGLNMESGNV